MYIENTRAIYDNNDYDNINILNLTKGVEPIAEGQYCVTDNILHGVGSSTKSVYLGIFTPIMQIGDIIEIEMQVKNMSDTKPVTLTIDECDKVTPPIKTAWIMALKSKTVGQWETLRFKYIVENNTYTGIHRLSFGKVYGDTGEFYIKDIKMKTYSANARTYEPVSVQGYMINKNQSDNGWTLRGASDVYFYKGGSLEIADTYRIKINFAKPFTKRPIVADGLVTGGGNNIFPRLTVSNNDIYISFYDSIGTQKLLSDVPNYAHFSFIAIGEI